MDAVRRRTSGLSADLSSVRDLCGRSVSLASGEGAVVDLFSPVYVRRDNSEQIDTELARLEYYPGMPKRTMSLNRVSLKLTPAQYSPYMELAGNEAEDPAVSLGARDLLNAIVQGSHPLSQVFQLLDDEQREQFIEGKLVDFRRQAREQLIREDASLVAEYDRRRLAGRVGL